MKKIFIAFALALATLTGNAQILSVSTYAGTDVTPFAGQIRDVRAVRQMFKGWNTISLPFSMTAEQVTANFGSDCRLECLASVSQNGDKVYLNFVDVKDEGIKANTPYILYYAKDNGVVTLRLSGARISNMNSELSFTTEQGVMISMKGADTEVAGNGLYGIKAVDNDEAKFVDVSSLNSKFFATRCFVEDNGTSNVELITRHLSKGEMTAINRVETDGNAEGNVTYNLAGQRVSGNAKGIKIVNGKKLF